MDNIKKFEDFLDRMQGLLDNAKKQGHIIVRVEDLENTFPELKEDEDERIKKAAVAFVKASNHFNYHLGISKEQVLAWLEKQVSIDENEVAKCVLNEVANSIMRWLDANLAEGNMCLSNMECEDIENAVRNANWQKIYGYMKKKLEKQGKPALEAVREEKADNQNCVNPSDKVEPKFHEGEWIISNDKKSTYQVIEVKRGIYVIRDIVDNHEYHIGIEECERDGRLWELSDAKDGDLIYVGTEEKGIQAIFHEYKNGTIFFHCYLCINFTQGGYMPIGDVEMVHPLQKIHHKRFFEKMHEAGYTFDFDKKELKKINNK